MPKGYCEVCGAEFERKPSIFARKVCSPKCRTIKWALKEANKVKEKKR